MCCNPYFNVLKPIAMNLKQRHPKTKKLLNLTASDTRVRLLPADRAFLRDLSRLQILSGVIASNNHYHHLKGGSRRSLRRLEKAGIIQKKLCFIRGRGVTPLYQFANEKLAQAWGGRMPEIGAKRNELHELITAELFYKTGQPEDFRLSNRMTEQEIAAFKGHRPDAVFTDEASGELVAVEADSGHYNRQQIKTKLALWQGHKQVWGQPQSVSARVPALPEITVHIMS